MYKRVWVTWEGHRRSRELAKLLRANLFEYKFNIQNRFFRYIKSTIKTLLMLRRENPALIFVQNPSVILAFFVVSWGLLFDIPVVVDAHNAGVLPFEGSSYFLNLLAIFIIRKSRITIVSNERLAVYVLERGGFPFILPDPVPDIQLFSIPEVVRDLKGKQNVLYICSFSRDEPYLKVIEAASLLETEICIYITGNYRRKRNLPKNIPKNVVLTGYLPETEFICMLHSVDVIVDLTERENCLLCGAYEAVAVGKPLIVSDTEVLRKHFRTGVLYTDNTSKDLADKIEEALFNKNHLGMEIKSLREELNTEWQSKRHSLERLLHELT